MKYQITITNKEKGTAVYDNSLYRNYNIDVENITDEELGQILREMIEVVENSDYKNVPF